MRNSGRTAHVEQRSGVNGRSYITYPVYLLLDKAQQSCWDHELWIDFSERIKSGTS